MREPLNSGELDSIRKAGAILKDCLSFLAREIKPGVDTKTLDKKATDFIINGGGKPAFLGYRGFPATICASRNNVVVHGIPSTEEVLRDGDIISLDVGVKYQGCFADAAKTFPVGKISSEAKKLISVTEEALYKGIEKAIAGNRIEDISHAVQSFVEANDFSIVRMFVGHGIGRKIHEEPEIPNFGKPDNGEFLQELTALAIEPMVNAGASGVEILKDGWTAVTKDRRLSAHFEHTVIVKKEKAEIVT